MKCAVEKLDLWHPNLAQCCFCGWAIAVGVVFRQRQMVNEKAAWPDDLLYKGPSSGQCDPGKWQHCEINGGAIYKIRQLLRGNGAVSGQQDAKPSRSRMAP